MKKNILITILLAGFSFLNAQSTFKQHTSKPHDTPRAILLSPNLPSLICDSRKTDSFQLNTINSIRTTHEAIEKFRILSSGSMWIDLKQNQLWSSRGSVNDLMGQLLPNSVHQGDWNLEWISLSETVDPGNMAHIRVQQNLAGHPIHGQQMILHIENGQLRDMNGFAWTNTLALKLPAPVQVEHAIEAARQHLIKQGIKFQTHNPLESLEQPDDQAHLVWLPQNGKLTLAYKADIHANMLDHWTIYVNASTLEIIRSFSQLCSIFPKQLYTSPDQYADNGNEKSVGELSGNSILLDGPSVTTDQDLLGQTRTVNGYLVGTNFFMIDASRTSMFNPMQSVMPNEPLGVIWTIDGQNRSPKNENFEAIHVTNTNNNWDPLEVSAHYNAGEAFEYFRQKFNRNSLNGDGGNIISLINIADDNGNGLDNAFWNGAAMFYGNGDVAFEPLAKGLDVAGHEMSHGVIQNTANLEYVGQSGALNESYADVFGSLIDRNDWQIGEDVVIESFFPSGALRDLSNPHNGGNGPNDPGWQPQHMNEFQVLPNTPEGDNGGVHVNSGIPNRAYFLFASAVGKEKAEQIYYKALRDYLVMSSQFIDMRNAVEKAAADLHGENSAEVIAARSAFDGVGIGAGQGEDHQEDIEVNDGDDFILATDELESDLYWIPPDNPAQFVKLGLPAPLSRPSFTDDGTAAVYVDQNNDMILVSFNWLGGGLDYQAFYLEDNPQGIWRNIVVSKDGTKIAYTTSGLTNEIWVFDFNSSTAQQFFLFNPTTAEGIETGDVLYADAMEWDYSGEYIMYDALNRIESAFGDGIEFWDISFLNAWDNDSDQFAEGLIGKLFNSLPENVSVGNPTFAKNSPFIITFDFVEDFLDQFGQLQTDYRILASNTETGVVNEIFQNTTVGYPSYSRLDDRILFTYDDFGSYLLATIGLQPTDKTLPVPGTDAILINGAQKGVWFQTGNRDFTSTSETDDNMRITLRPQPVKDILSVSFEEGQAVGMEYQVFDVNGRPLLNGKLLNQSIDVDRLPSGVYVLALKDGNISHRQIFIKSEVK